MTGCVKTETVVVTKTVATIPPEYLYDSERLPTVPADVPASERTVYVLEAFASRGDVIKRDQKQGGLMQKWVDEIRALYPETIVHPLGSVEDQSDFPENGSE